MTKEEREQLNNRVNEVEKAAMSATHTSQLIGKDIAYIKRDVSEIKETNRLGALASTVEMKELKAQLAQFMSEIREGYATKKSVEDQELRIDSLEKFKAEINAKAGILGTVMGLIASLAFSIIKDKI